MEIKHRPIDEQGNYGRKVLEEGKRGIGFDKSRETKKSKWTGGNRD